MKQKRMQNDIKIQVLFALYVYALFKVILFKFGSIDITFLGQQLKRSLGNPDNITRQLHQGNLIPFQEISRTMHALTSNGLINLVGNIAIFMPFGIFIGLILKNKKLSFIGAFILSLGLSLCLESTQVIFSIGRFDVDDLILNSIGGMVGFIAFRLCVKFVAVASGVIPARSRSI
jgi:glycopeptide antibiotics resistance protein